MNEEKIKELLSISFVRLIAERADYVVTKPSEDFGDDLYVKRLNIISKIAGLQYATTGELIGLQVKCITQNRFKLNNDVFAFDLREKTYNHLIYRTERWRNNHKIPLVLVVVVLPDDKSKWLAYNQDSEILQLSAKGFWHIPLLEAKISTNKSTQRISISAKNTIHLNFFDQLFQVLHPKINQP